MKQCWDADPLKRPDIVTLRNKINEINVSYQNVSDELVEANDSLETSNLETNNTSRRLFTSKVHQFEKFSEPRNATEGIICIKFICQIVLLLLFLLILSFIFNLYNNNRR